VSTADFFSNLPNNPVNEYSASVAAEQADNRSTWLPKTRREQRGDRFIARPREPGVAGWTTPRSLCRASPFLRGQNAPCASADPVTRKSSAFQPVLTWAAAQPISNSGAGLGLGPVTPALQPALALTGQGVHLDAVASVANLSAQLQGASSGFLFSAATSALAAPLAVNQASATFTLTGQQTPGQTSGSDVPVGGFGHDQATAVRGVAVVTGVDPDTHAQALQQVVSEWPASASLGRLADGMDADGTGAWASQAGMDLWAMAEDDLIGSIPERSDVTASPLRPERVGTRGGPTGLSNHG
jgi:hypothetical protein